MHQPGVKVCIEASKVIGRGPEGRGKGTERGRGRGGEGRGEEEGEGSGSGTGGEGQDTGNVGVFGSTGRVAWRLPGLRT